jgi:ribonuclease HII
MAARLDKSGGPDFTLEIARGARNGFRVAGLDEAGRGPWAGPVVAAAVILDPDRIPVGLNDSKKLSSVVRERLYAEIFATAQVGVGEASAAMIDEINVLQASLLAMRLAVEALLGAAPGAALVDGLHCPALSCPATPVVKGDACSLSIAAASIVAKVTRDRMMARLAREFPGYGWERNMGYGTREHATALTSLGVTPQHRRSFAPILAALAGKV